jgi:hypothetical protein
LGAALEQVMRIWEEDTMCHAVPLQHFANLEKFSENNSRNAYQIMHCLEHGRQNAYRKQPKKHMENPINYPYKAGALQGFIQFLSYGIKIPGVEITDHKAFEEYLSNELKRIEEESRDR